VTVSFGRSSSGRTVAEQGTLFVVSAPSGAGKHTVLARVAEQDAGIEHTVSATTRPPRPGEIDGKDYYFLNEAEFRRRVAAGDFVEWAEVHGNLYGTLREDLSARIQSGKDVVLELDVQGMRSLKALRNDVVTVFLMAPSFEALEERIRKRRANDEASIALRLANAHGEMADRHEYDYVVTNDVAEKAAAEVLAIVRAHRKRVRRQSDTVPSESTRRGAPYEE